VEPLEALRAGLGTGSMLGGRLSLCLQQLRRYVPPPLDARDEALCEALEEALTAREAHDASRAGTREQLLARVYADPEDLTARMVLADHLLEGGDPLGELITLQCMPRADEARIEVLLSEHRLRWEAPLGAYVERECARFERGFPVSVKMRRGWGERLPEPLPCWATVREIDWAGAVFPDVAKWLSHPHLRGVTTLRRMDPELAEGLGARGHPVKQLGVVGPVAKKCPELFQRLAELPGLTRLLVQEASPEDVHLCAASRLASRLERFEARFSGVWSLVAAPAKEVPLKATLMREAGTESLARAIRGAAGFGAKALRIRLEDRETPGGRSLLESAAFAYEKVEWF
ncbi:MAG TPA: TIGR02996 domain-containing protein, partial [Myxococcus sp.]|nr:TIGR02996 domain-containing protein [Myxococcus sp.]